MNYCQSTVTTINLMKNVPGAMKQGGLRINEKETNYMDIG